MNYKINVLDQTPYLENGDAQQSFQHTIKLAKLAESLGYSRFWLSEHHQSNSVAGSSPEVLISHLLAHTKTIRIGSGGIMLSHYSPFKVAENFAVLENLAPGRIDLGVGKAPGGLPAATKALQYDRQSFEDNFNEKLTLLQQFVTNTIPENSPFSGLTVSPETVNPTPIYVLGGSANSAKEAAALKLDYVFAAFINGSKEVLQQASSIYKTLHPKGKFIVAFSMIGAETDEEAQRLGEKQKVFKIKLTSGKTYSLASKEQAYEFGKQINEPFEVYEEKATVQAGSPATIKKLLDDYHTAYNVDEFIFHTILPTNEERERSYTLLSPKNLAQLKEVAYAE
ncbi:MAG: LLM class flavin-dependent oxidoreductase [Solibacillus sp.]